MPSALPTMQPAASAGTQFPSLTHLCYNICLICDLVCVQSMCTHSPPPNSMFSVLLSCRCTFWSEQHPELEAAQSSSGEAAELKTCLKRTV